VDKKMEKVVLFGNGQIASVAYFYLTHDSPYEVVAFTVDRDYLTEKEMFGLPVVPFEDVQSIYPPDRFKMYVSVSFRKVNKLRAEKYAQAKEKGYTLISYVSSKATTWPGLSIGDNCFIMENNVIQPFVKIGNNVIMWSGNHIGHHTTIQDHCFLASHVVVSGSVTVGPYCFFGVNATTRDGITIAPECVIGAGTLILKDTVEKGVYIGKPAELLSKRSDELKHI
jgi:sugar O-acyltransferase (sialic acid O-acetyltransferase NeuD family)